ncbi:MAG TPA: DUF4214 domain-containing protein [Thermoanaerobaculia bacterium]|nr:DUF4214 domain-containing protein [Thermoanaerobaculia bacterium]
MESTEDGRLDEGSPGHPRRGRTHGAFDLIVILFYLALTVVLTWPLGRNLSRAVADPGDPYLVAWILDWGIWATFNRPLELFHANIFHPARYTLAFSENLYGIALLLIPFRLASLSPLTLYNIAFFLGFTFSGYGAFVLTREITRSKAAALVAGLVYAFVPFRFDHISHLQIIWGGWLPIVLYALLRLYRLPTRKNAAFFGVAFFFNGLTNVHWLLLGSVALGASALFLMMTLERARRLRFAAHLAGALLIGMLALIPFLLPYARASSLYDMKRDRPENLSGSAEPRDWFIPSATNALYGHLPIRAEGVPERTLFPGLAAIVLATSGLLLIRKGDLPPASFPRASSVPRPSLLRAMDATIVLLFVVSYWARASGELPLVELEVRPSMPAMLLTGLIMARLWIRLPDAAGGSRGLGLRDLATGSRTSPQLLAAILWLGIGIIGSLGLRTFFHQFLFDYLVVFQSIRAPVRWAMIAYAGLAVLVGVGTLTLLRNRSRSVSAAITAAIVVVVLFDLRPVQIPWHLGDPARAAVYEWLARSAPPGAIVELPLSLDGMSEVPYVLASTRHHRPLVNGASGFYPPVHRELALLFAASPIDPRFVERLEGIDCAMIVVHADRLGARSSEIRRWLREEMDRGRLKALRAFDDGIGGVYVFATRRLEAGEAESEVRDGSGRTEIETTKAFLETAAIPYHASSFGRVELPRPESGVWGRLRVTGWVASPSGISRATLLLQNGSMRIDLPLRPRRDLLSEIPWYGESGVAGFDVVIPNRPRRVRTRTDLEVEIVDGEGRKTRLSFTPFRWWKWSEPDPVPPDQWDEGRIAELFERLGLDDRAASRLLSGSVTIDELVTPAIEAYAPLPPGELLRRLYLLLLGREPEASGLALYYDRLAAGVPREVIVRAFLASPEFRERYRKR